MEELSHVDWDEKKRRLVDLLEPLFVAYLYFVAVVQPILGIVLGIVALKKCELEKNRRVGRICFIISAVALGFWALCLVAYIIVVVAVTTRGGAGGI